MELSVRDRALLEGEAGEAARLAMELVVAVGEAEGASRLVDIEAAHIDGCLYHGRAGLDFARRLVEGSGRVSVPTTLNVASLDLLHPDLYRGDPTTAAEAKALMEAHLDLGCQPTWTCAPYQLPRRPKLGQQIAWGESNAIVFANSVLGARTNRYGDFLDICCAITGRAPYTGLHTDEGRLATLQVNVDVADELLGSELFYPSLGHVLGEVSGVDIPVVVGLDSRADEDRLKALGAAAASSGAVAMFHVVGVTPEAPTLEAALGSRPPTRVVTVTEKDLRRARESLSSGSGPLGAISLGTPHMSLKELRHLSLQTAGLTTRVPFYVSTGRDIAAQARKEGLLEALESFGATLVVDTCTYVTPIMDAVSGVVMTNSAKWAYYATANLGVSVRLASTDDCVASAVAGEVVLEREWG
ncbi:MAG: aconitase X [Acidimicrobiia bacterium]